MEKYVLFVAITVLKLYNYSNHDFHSRSIFYAKNAKC